MPITLEPLHDRVIVKRLSAERKSVLIFIPEQYAEKPDLGEVVAVGPGRFDAAGVRMPMTLKPGDTILFGKYSGQVVAVEDNEYLVMREEDLFAIVRR